MNKKLWNNPRCWVITVCITVVSCLSAVAVEAKCDLADLQRCTSCGELQSTIDPKNTDSGDYYRGAYWNGLYAAYRLNCQTVAKTLLDNKANPNLGGSAGSLLYSISRSWPHKDEKINKQWAGLLNNYSVDVDWKNPYTDKSAREIIEQDEMPIDYPDIWKSLVAKSKQGAK